MAEWYSISFVCWRFPVRVWAGETFLHLLKKKFFFKQMAFICKQTANLVFCHLHWVSHTLGDVHKPCGLTGGRGTTFILVYSSDGSGLGSGLESPPGPTHFCQARPARSPIQKARKPGGFFRAENWPIFDRFPAEFGQNYETFCNKIFFICFGPEIGRKSAYFGPIFGRFVA